MNIKTKKVNFKVFRFNSETDILPYYKEYSFDVTQEEVVLDILNKIKSGDSGNLSYRRSCRHGICGACAIKVNNKSILACKERVFDLVELYGDKLTIDPLSEKRAVKDLVTDKKDFWEKYDLVQPYLKAEIDETPTKENLIEPEQVEELSEADYCIQCGACYYSCPVVDVNPDYIGPAALAKAFRFNSDVRDSAKQDRLEVVNQMVTGIWDCVKCYECAEVCPKDVNPIEKITKLHNQVFEENMAINNVATRHAVGFKKSIEKHGFLDEGGLVLYSEGICGMPKHLPEACSMLKNGKLPMPWNLPKSKNLDEVKTVVKISSTSKF
jgi:succinate dehydrogenase / fumarate reductase iron-sulfur subunit